jgi:hypothetical protein
MPYFLCPTCAVRAYSAAGESRCPACDAPLRRSNQLAASIPCAEPLTRRLASPAAGNEERFRKMGRFGRSVRRHLPQPGP